MELFLTNVSFIEYYNKTITRLFRGNPLYGCYGLGVTIFCLGIIRDALFVPCVLVYSSNPALLEHIYTNSH